jgi:hypothetical protein
VLEPTTTTTPAPPEDSAVVAAPRRYQYELCHSPRHNLPIVTGAYSDLPEKWLTTLDDFRNYLISAA